jgi:arylsulfatase A-like enzyme
VAFVDDQFGQLLDWMEEKGYLDNTIIAFVSDHGTHLSDHGRVQKGTFYDPSAKVCYQFWYPGTVAEGVLIETPVETRSMLPTILELAGLELPEDLADISLADHLIRGSEPEVRPVFSEMSFGFDPRHPDNRVVMVRDGDWKLSWCPDVPTEKGELVNLKQDPYEQNNLYGQPESREVQERLIGLIEAHLEGTEKPFRNVAILDELVRDDGGNVVCPTCKRRKIRNYPDPATAPDWTEGLNEGFSCGHCGTRFGTKQI